MELINVKYKITFFSYWHAGGKDGASMEMDNAVLKDIKGLPYIGGKTLKGLIRDGAEFIEKCQPELFSENFINDVFGQEDKKYCMNENGLTINKFNSATLEDSIDKKYVSLLFHKKDSTAIGKNKQAKDYSLRTSEVCLPLTLIASIENFNNSDLNNLKLCFQAVKRLGENRFKGLGRCVFEIIEPENNIKNV